MGRNIIRFLGALMVLAVIASWAGHTWEIGWDDDWANRSWHRRTP